MNEELYKKFLKELDSADWNLLKDHFKREALFIVDQDLDLAQVALAIAEDSVKLVKDWLGSNKIRKVEAEETKLWEASPNQFFCHFLIVQPYVLIKLIKQDELQ